DSYEALMKTYSDFVVSCGSQTAPVNVYMAKENNARNIIIMKPDIIGLGQFSLAIIPKHDHPPARKNVVPTVLAPNLIDRESMRNYGAILGQQVKIEKDIVLGALIGGDNPEFAMTKDMANKAISGLIEFCKAYDADLLLTTSRRTPKDVEALIKDRLSKYSFCKLMVIANEKNIEGAVAGILDLCNIVAVSGESVSMVSEAINSGKKAVIFDLEKKNKNVTKYERVLDSLEGEGYVNCAHPSDLGTRLSKVWKTVRAIRAVDDRQNITEAIKRLL
ncbi:MAG: mitochondrial fission ELM1 family protein, partial [Candidatus Dadabacteria bacterium]|nr:mitochondrial fission ELM1 family protein [Candidatus Dadabacteria bacterium]